MHRNHEGTGDKPGGIVTQLADDAIDTIIVDVSISLTKLAHSQRQTTSTLNGSGELELAEDSQQTKFEVFVGTGQPLERAEGFDVSFCCKQVLERNQPQAALSAQRLCYTSTIVLKFPGWISSKITKKKNGNNNFYDFLASFGTLAMANCLNFSSSGTAFVLHLLLLALPVYCKQATKL